jgi:hypothetical protein
VNSSITASSLGVVEIRNGDTIVKSYDEYIASNMHVKKSGNDWNVTNIFGMSDFNGNPSSGLTYAFASVPTNVLDIGIKDENGIWKIKSVSDFVYRSVSHYFATSTTDQYAEGSSTQ